MSLDSIDKRVKNLIKLSAKRNNRCLFSILGPGASKQVSVFHEFLVKKKKAKVTTLYCSKESSDLFDKNNKAWVNIHQTEDVNFHHCSYSDVETISHRCFHFAVLQDIEQLTPDALSSILQTIQGGGIILLLFPSMRNLEDLMALNLKVCSTPSRFSKRFALSLCSYPGLLILNDKLEVLSSGQKLPKSLEDESLSQLQKIEELQQKHENDSTIASLIGLCHTLEQAELLLKFQDALKNSTSHRILSVSGPVGTGKSAALGLAIALSLVLKYSNIYISAMCPRNVTSVFKMVLNVLDVLGYEEDKDFDLIVSDNPKFKNTLMGINVFKDHPQSVRFIFPGDISHHLDQAELVVFDEAASIPLSILKNLFGSYVVLMASSTSGPGASSPYLYNNMIVNIKPSTSHASEGDRFQTLTLNEPIHFASEDCIESWMNQTLCLEPSISSHLSCGFPKPEDCRLCCVNRDILLNGSNQSEICLQDLASILSSSSRTINPDHLINIADSSNYRIFCLLPPAVISHESSKKFEEKSIICAIEVHVEQEIPNHINQCAENLSGPISNCFDEWKTVISTSSPGFVSMQGAHILNIVTHQSYRKMGYGLRALQLLQEFYEGKCINLDENGINSVEDTTVFPESVVNIDSKPDSPLMQQLTEIQVENVEYILASCNLVPVLLKFWKKAGFVPVFMSEKTNLEGEHKLFMVKSVVEKFELMAEKYWRNFLRYYCSQLGSEFRTFDASLALTLMRFNSKLVGKDSKDLVKADIDFLIRPHHMKSLEKYCQNLQDFHSIMQFIPTLAGLFFKNNLKDVELSRVQEAILLSFGLQYKTADEISKDLGLPNMQIHGLLNRTLKKLTRYLTDIIEKSVAKTMETPDIVMKPVDQDLNEELEQEARKIKKQQEVDALKLRDLDVSQYAIKGSEDDWQKALISGRKTLVSIKSIKTKIDTAEIKSHCQQNSKKNKHQKKRKR